MNCAIDARSLRVRRHPASRLPGRSKEPDRQCSKAAQQCCHSPGGTTDVVIDPHTLSEASELQMARIRS